MWNWLYNASIGMFQLAVHAASAFNKKAKAAIQGRQQVEQKLTAWRLLNPGKLYWFHCASLGEFEQGRSVIEAFRSADPKAKILLTFFSPSGYEIRKNYAGVDYVTYLPWDQPSRMRRFIAIAQPDAVLVVKYEFWVNWLRELRVAGVPVYLISAKLRPNQRFFGFMGAWWQQTLRNVHHFFTQDELTAHLLNSIEIQNHTVTGDTRFDRVHAIQQQGQALPALAQWISGHRTLVIGSSWEMETEMALKLSSENPQWRIVIVPHDVDQEAIKATAERHKQCVTYTNLEQAAPAQNTLLVNTTGILSLVYQYADVVVIGGGFGKGIHNTLEAAVWGKPVLFGPCYQKFNEAVGLIESQGASSSESIERLHNEVIHVMNAPNRAQEMGAAAKKYVESHLGATQKIMQHPEIQRILKK